MRDRGPLLPYRRAVALGLVVTLATGLLAPAVEARAERTPGRVTVAVARRLFGALHRILDATSRIASRSDRVDLELTEELLDPNQRMRFRVEGQVRVRVRSDARRARLAEALLKGEGRTFTANGPISADLHLVPLEIEGEEVVFDVVLDLMVITDVLLQILVRNGGALLVGVGIGQLAEGAAAALEGFRVEVAGGALALGVENLPEVLAGEAGAIAYASYDDPEHHTWREKLKANLTPRGLLRHFLLALVFFAGSKLVTSGVKTVAAAGLAALLPTGGPFVAALLATGFWMLLGHRMVKALTIKAPFYLRMARIQRLWRKAQRVEGADRARLVARIEGSLGKITARFLRESEAAYKPFDFLMLLTGYLAKRVRDRMRPGSRDAPLDLAPLAPLIEAVERRMTQLSRGDGGWYAARLLAQFRDACGAS